VIVLDTNVVSELMRPVPDRNMLKWLDAQSPDTLWLTSVNVAELLFGIARLAQGARKRTMAQTVATMLEEDFSHQILNFDVEAAAVFATMAAQRERQGQPVSLADGQIAAICLTHKTSLATRNTRHFEGLGLQLLNPWEL
jgi:predicted nucleic acid-binding protein